MQSRIRNALIVGGGACVGAWLRYACGIVLDGFIAMILVNALGCFLMGLLQPQLFWGTGVLGGFTTFSSFVVLIALLQFSLLTFAILVVLGGLALILLYAFGWQCRQYLEHRNDAEVA